MHLEHLDDPAPARVDASPTPAPPRSGDRYRTGKAVGVLLAYERDGAYTVQYDYEDTAAFAADRPRGMEVIHAETGDLAAYVEVNADGSLQLRPRADEATT